MLRSCRREALCQLNYWLPYDTDERQRTPNDADGRLKYEDHRIYQEGLGKEKMIGLNARKNGTFPLRGIEKIRQLETDGYANGSYEKRCREIIHLQDAAMVRLQRYYATAI